MKNSNYLDKEQLLLKKQSIKKRKPCEQTDQPTIGQADKPKTSKTNAQTSRPTKNRTGEQGNERAKKNIGTKGSQGSETEQGKTKWKSTSDQARQPTDKLAN